jgi:hypothetical protein
MIVLEEMAVDTPAPDRDTTAVRACPKSGITRALKTAPKKVGPPETVSPQILAPPAREPASGTGRG